jgi:hypothetical protein
VLYDAPKARREVFTPLLQGEDTFNATFDALNHAGDLAAHNAAISAFANASLEHLLKVLKLMRNAPEFARSHPELISRGLDSLAVAESALDAVGVLDHAAAHTLLGRAHRARRWRSYLLPAHKQVGSTAAYLPFFSRSEISRAKRETPRFVWKPFLFT